MSDLSPTKKLYPRLVKKLATLSPPNLNSKKSWKGDVNVDEEDNPLKNEIKNDNSPKYNVTSSKYDILSSNEMVSPKVDLYSPKVDLYNVSSSMYTVDIDGASQVIDESKNMITSTHNENVVSSWGSFGGCYALNNTPINASQHTPINSPKYMPDIKTIKDPVLVSSTDSLGSKILLAAKFNKWENVGHDIVNHCINDILVQGARPLYFMDYIATSKFDKEVTQKILKSVSKACQAQGIPLLGGETAEIKNMFTPNSFDLVGFITGLVDRSHMIDGLKIKAGNLILALPSDGFHTNGYTLINQYATEEKASWLLRPHKCYLKDLHYRLNMINGLVHVTGGGISGNCERILPKGLKAHISEHSWTVPEYFKWIKGVSGISKEEMFKVFNMGLGMIVFIDPNYWEYFKDLMHVGFVSKI